MTPLIPKTRASRPSTTAVQKKTDSGITKADVSAGDAAKQKDGISLIAAERHRQLEVEHWTPDHDDRHDAGELAIAAMCYAAYAGNLLHPYTQGDGDWRTTPPEWWPWGQSWWKPTDDPVRALEKAGALIAAEIDRQLRLETGAGNSVAVDGGEHAASVSSPIPPPSPSPSPEAISSAFSFEDHCALMDAKNPEWRNALATSFRLQGSWTHTKIAKEFWEAAIASIGLSSPGYDSTADIIYQVNEILAEAVLEYSVGRGNENQTMPPVTPDSSPKPAFSSEVKEEEKP